MKTVVAKAKVLAETMVKATEGAMVAIKGTAMEATTMATMATMAATSRAHMTTHDMAMQGKD